MNLKEFLTYFFKETTPDEEERGDAPRDSRDGTKASENLAADNGVAVQGGGAPNSTDDKDDADLGQDDDEAPDADLNNQPDASPRGPRRVLSRIWTSIFPTPNNEEEIQAYVPHYRVLPILSGIIIPFCILLEVPGLTEAWFIRVDGSTIVSSKPNPPLLIVGITLSIFCAVVANVCLVFRFLEKRIKTTTILCAVFLSIHDTINVVALATYGAAKDGYSYSHAFWMTLCSTIVSTFTNVTLIVDLVRTPDFARSGSGLTRRQRSLVIIIIGFFCYITLGALVNSFLLDLTFLNGLYFTVVTIETIGFGDIVPKTRSSRIFTCFYATVGVINVAFVVGYVREAVLEGLDFGYRRRLLEIQEKRRAARFRRRAEKRWRHAIIWRLRERHAHVWIPKETDERESVWSILSASFWHALQEIRPTAWRSTHQTHGRYGTQLNLWALPQCELEAAALEAGCTLDTFLPENFYDTYDITGQRGHSIERHALPSWFAIHPVYRRDERPSHPPTHRRLGAMAAILTKLGFVVYESGGSPLPSGRSIQDPSGTEISRHSTLSMQTSSSGSYREEVEDVEKKAYYTRSGLSWGWFFIFWMGGAAIFKATEGWSYGSAVYFCFIAFTTIGYGDLVPTTQAARSIFVVWALIGVGTMTIFISVVSEAYTSRYKGILGRNSFNSFVRQYRKRTKTELVEKVQHFGSSADQGVVAPNAAEYSATIAQGEPSTSAAAAEITPAVPLPSESDQVQHVQRSLEMLPHQVLTETHSIEGYIHLITEFDEHSAETEGFVSDTVSSLIEDVMGRQMTVESKKDILKDGESRQTLMLLGIERSLKELVGISEQAMVAIRERDQIIANLERGKE